MKFSLKFPKSILAIAPIACATILLTLPGACGGGGGGLAPLPFGTADINITNDGLMNFAGISNGICGDGMTMNIYTLESVTITSTTTGQSRSYTFAPPIPIGGTAPMIGGVPPGDFYDIEAIYTGTGPLIHETDQCPADGFTVAPGVNAIVMQY